jgi:DNA-binding HxlR family transcriptional regulator
LQSLTQESEFRRTHKNLETKYKREDVTYMNCPVEASLGVLGRKWTIVIIRDIGVYGRDRFNLLLKSLAGIPPKVLATRLKQLEQEGFIEKHVEKSVPPQGRQVVADREGTRFDTDRDDASSFWVKVEGGYGVRGQEATEDA